MRRPNKPHINGYEDEEDCEGYYDPDEEERRGCHHIIQRSPNDPCQRCFEAWKVKEDARLRAEWDAKSPEEKAHIETFIKELRDLDAKTEVIWEKGKPVLPANK